jgi:hypothetical protein
VLQLRTLVRELMPCLRSDGDPFQAAPSRKQHDRRHHQPEANPDKPPVLVAEEL